MPGSHLPSESESDRELVRRLAAGERHAFDELYRRHCPQLMAFLSSRMNATDAEDVGVEVWLKVHRSPPVDEQQHFRGWLFLVARNEITNHHRKHRRNAGQFEDGQEANVAAAGSLNPDDDQRHTDLQGCLDSIDPKFAAALRLWMNGFKHSEISSQLGIPEATSYTQVGRGKDQVKDCLQRKGWTR